MTSLPMPQFVSDKCVKKREHVSTVMKALVRCHEAEFGDLAEPTSRSLPFKFRRLMGTLLLLAREQRRLAKARGLHLLFCAKFKLSSASFRSYLKMLESSSMFRSTSWLSARFSSCSTLLLTLKIYRSELNAWIDWPRSFWERLREMRLRQAFTPEITCWSASDVRALSVKSRCEIKHIGCLSRFPSSSAPLAPILTLFL